MCAFDKGVDPDDDELVDDLHEQALGLGANPDLRVQGLPLAGPPRHLLRLLDPPLRSGQGTRLPPGNSPNSQLPPPPLPSPLRWEPHDPHEPSTCNEHPRDMSDFFHESGRSETTFMSSILPTSTAMCSDCATTTSSSFLMRSSTFVMSSTRALISAAFCRISRSRVCPSPCQTFC